MQIIWLIVMREIDFFSVVELRQFMVIDLSLRVAAVAHPNRDAQENVTFTRDKLSIGMSISQDTSQIESINNSFSNIFYLMFILSALPFDWIYRSIG